MRYLLIVLVLSGCASRPEYICTTPSGDVYYGHSYSDIVITEDQVLIGECEKR